MFKIPRQEYTTEFKQLTVKRVSGGGDRPGGAGTGADPGHTRAVQGRLCYRPYSNSLEI